MKNSSLKLSGVPIHKYFKSSMFEALLTLQRSIYQYCKNRHFSVRCKIFYKKK